MSRITVSYRQEGGFSLRCCADGCWDLAGEVDLSNADAFAACLAGVASVAHPIRLRLSRLRFMDLAGIHVIARLALARPEQRIVLEDVPAVLRRCWPLLDYDTQLCTVELQS